MSVASLRFKASRKPKKRPLPLKWTSDTYEHFSGHKTLFLEDFTLPYNRGLCANLEALLPLIGRQ